MSKPVRLPDYLYAEVERLAKEERRSLANMVQVLLEQSLKLDGEPRTKVESHDFGGDVQVTTTARTERRSADENIQSSAGFVTPQGREEAERVMTGNTDLIDHFTKSAPDGVAPSYFPEREFKPDPKPERKK